MTIKRLFSTGHSRRQREGTQHRAPAHLQKAPVTLCQPEGTMALSCGVPAMSLRHWGHSLGTTKNQSCCAFPASLTEAVWELLHLKDASTRFKVLLQKTSMTWDSQLSRIQSTFSLKDDRLRSKLLLCGLEIHHWFAALYAWFTNSLHYVTCRNFTSKIDLFFLVLWQNCL